MLNKELQAEQVIDEIDDVMNADDTTNVDDIVSNVLYGSIFTKMLLCSYL